MTARKVTAEPWDEAAEEGRLLAELEDLREQYAGRSSRRQRYYDWWMLVTIHDQSIARVARSADRHESTVRERVAAVMADMQQRHGPQLGELLRRLRYCRDAA